MYEFLFLGLSIGDMILCWYAYKKQYDLLRKITKPLFCLLMIGYVSTAIQITGYLYLFILGLFFSFVGVFSFDQSQFFLLQLFFF